MKWTILGQKVQHLSNSFLRRDYHHRGFTNGKTSFHSSEINCWSLAWTDAYNK